jgi:hypothetical protein
MTLIRHLVAHDLSRLRLVLFVWVILVAAGTLVQGGHPLVAADRSLREAMTVVGSVIWLTQLLIGFAIVSFVVHAHPTVGTDAFWMTRPIPPGRLLLSKLLLIAVVLVFIPVISEAALLAAYRVPVGIASGVLAQRIELQTVIAALLMMGAALTRNIGTFALLCGSALLAVAISIAIFVAIMTARVADGSFAEMESTASDATEMFVFNLLFVASALLMLTVQYRTRLRSRSVATGLLAVSIAYVASSWWPVPFLSPQPLIPLSAHDERLLTITAVPATITTTTPTAFFPGQEVQWSAVNGRVDVQGLSPGWSATVAVRDATLELAGDEVLRSVGGTFVPTYLLGGEAQTPPVIRDLLGVTRVASDIPVPPPSPPVGHATLFRVSRDELARRPAARGDYRARVILMLTNYVIDGVLPLREGVVHRNGAHMLAIDNISRPNGALALNARESRATSVWERRPWSQYSFYLRNRVRQEALSLRDYDLQGEFTFMRFLPFSGFSVGASPNGGFFTRAFVLTVPRWSGHESETPIADDWLREAEVVIVRTTQEGAVERALQIPEFPLGNSAP